MSVELSKNGINKNIKAHILSDDRMKEIGFKDRGETWRFYKDITHDISFSVRIDKQDIDNLAIDVLDEDWGQPYDYQYMLKENPKFKFGLMIKEKVEEYMKYLQDNGILSGHKYGEYI